MPVPGSAVDLDERPLLHDLDDLEPAILLLLALVHVLPLDGCRNVDVHEIEGIVGPGLIGLSLVAEVGVELGIVGVVGIYFAI